MDRLGKDAFSDEAHTVHSRIVDLYHAHTNDRSQQRIINSFSLRDSPLRCLVATVAFGLGVNIPNVELVLHWGASRDVLAYWQEVGRCGRDGRAGKAILYKCPGACHKARVDEKLRIVIENSFNNSTCLRKEILRQLFVTGMSTDALENCSKIPKCCFVCDKTPV